VARIKILKIPRTKIDEKCCDKRKRALISKFNFMNLQNRLKDDDEQPLAAPNTDASSEPSIFHPFHHLPTLMSNLSIKQFTNGASSSKRWKTTEIMKLSHLPIHELLEQKASL
jgi:hypothetical protein